MHTACQLCNWLHGFLTYVFEIAACFRLYTMTNVRVLVETNNQPANMHTLQVAMSKPVKCILAREMQIDVESIYV